MNKKTVDMTKGSPLGLILAFAVPFFIGSIFQQIYSMVDTMVAGYKLGDGAIAAIGASASLYSLIINIAMGLNSGYGIVVTRCFGSREIGKMRQAVAGMTVLNIAITAALTAGALAFMKPLLRYMNTPAAVFADAYGYIFIICAGMICTVLYNMFAAIMRAVGNSRAPLWFLVISSLLNVALDLLFIMGLGTGVWGAALATVMAQGVSAALAGAYVRRNYRDYLPSRADLRLPAPLLGELLTTGLAMALMACVVDLGSVILNRANNLLGEAAIAANAAGRRLWGLMLMPQSAVGVANSTFMAQNWGARKHGRIKTALRQVCAVVCGWSAFACVLFFLTGDWLVRFTTGTSDPEIVRGGVLLARASLVCAPALGVLVVLRNTLQALGRKVIPVLSSAIELLMKVLAARWAIPAFGFTATALTEPVTWVLMMLFLLWGWHRSKKQMFTE